MNEFLDRIVEDLRAFAPELLEPGLAPALQGNLTQGPPASIAAIVRAVDEFERWLPSLIEDAVGAESAHRFEVESTPIPRRAVLSRRASDYGRSGTAVVPRRFEVFRPLQEPDPHALRYLLHRVEWFAEQLGPARRRTFKHVETARLARAGGSVFAEEDARALTAMVDHFERTDARLDRMRAALRRASSVPLRPRSNPPHPYPTTPVWTSLRRQALRWADGVQVCLEEMRNQLMGGARTADLPFLYQRWCGVQLLAAFEAEGWTPRSDAVGAMFLGGRIVLGDGSTSLDLWVEPRLSTSTDQATPFRCSEGEEVTPDFLIVAAGPQGPDAFVLDATKTSDEAVLTHKFSYLRRIVSAGTRLVAGIPVAYAPQRSWAAAPLGGSICQLRGGDGRRGIVPMHPVDGSAAPVRAWVRDVIAHARAWAS